MSVRNVIFVFHKNDHAEENARTPQGTDRG